VSPAAEAGSDRAGSPLAFEFQAVVLGLRDKFPQLLHQDRPLPPVVKLPRLLAESLELCYKKTALILKGFFVA
jgi:hypothetical protein